MIPLHFENENFVLAMKPSGYLSVPSRFGDKDSRPVLGKKLEAQLGLRLFPVHRLDFEVSGLILFAKNASAHRAANQWFEQKKVRKVYQALTTGMPPELGKKFEWKSKILRGKKRAYESPVGKPSLTLAEYQGQVRGLDGNQYLLWSLEPVTGRGHQLRFDLARHGFPIVGDVLYGSPICLNNERIQLCAVRAFFPEEALTFGLSQEYEIKPLGFETVAV